ncbi:ABC transporter ATP-binding protein [Mucisphaera calidilacus]|uniref:Putative ABC transporter ATP-binding protein YbhF n=1 Tax=Mucisphaera calidilacus TaxID=2527982 RepID=A0A518BV76_9BACT|nr:ABC transporter ATP-binding protein [Mucisphaera calidilacus]QDU70861.1 putative ABC transporter ATP-binding protein YbhF [Mucisphaera calidilacus]
MTTNAAPSRVDQAGQAAVRAEPAVVIDGLSHRYPKADVLALDDVNLRMASGSFTAVLGPNGSGKSTLFRILTTAVRATGKPGVVPRVTILGHDLRVGAHAIRQRLGVVFQSPSLDSELSVVENLRLQGRVYGMSGSELRRRIPERLEAVGLSDRAHDRVGTLSGGLARRAELAKALLHDPRILILDEPSTGVDPTARRQFWQSLEAERRRSGLTVLMTTHLTDEAEAADNVVVLSRGRVVAEGSPAALKADSRAVLAVATRDADALLVIAEDLVERFGGDRLPERVFGEARIELAEGAAALRWVLDEHGGAVRSVTLSEPTLEDVFERTTGTIFTQV